MINIPEAFYDGTAAILVTMGQYTDLLEQFHMEEIPVWNPDYLKKWTKERTKEDGAVHAYYDEHDEEVSCFSLHSPDVNNYEIYQYEDLIIPDPAHAATLQSVLDLLQ